ncbi:MAG: sulfite exporter TauE/SafE family protein, partial [Thermodesulfobacteriota bacterium]
VRARRIHFHVHRHGDGAPHLHAHAHDRDTGSHEHSAHAHQHRATSLPRALAIGTLHGLAGSGALVLVALPMLGSPAQALLYVASFALGSVAGMVLFSLVLSLPLAWCPRLLQASAGKLEAALGVATIAIGGWMALQAAAF